MQSMTEQAEPNMAIEAIVNRVVGLLPEGRDHVARNSRESAEEFVRVLVTCIKASPYPYTDTLLLSCLTSPLAFYGLFQLIPAETDYDLCFLLLTLSSIKGDGFNPIDINCFERKFGLMAKYLARHIEATSNDNNQNGTT